MRAAGFQYSPIAPRAGLTINLGVRQTALADLSGSTVTPSRSLPDALRGATGKSLRGSPNVREPYPAGETSA